MCFSRSRPGVILDDLAGALQGSVNWVRVSICMLRRPAALVLRPVRLPPAFSLTVSFVGKRNYTSEEIKAVLAYEIESKHRGWVYQQDDRAADLNVRVFLEHDVAAVGVRLAKTALHDRWYQRMHLPGALKPSVAAALVLLAQTTSTTRVLDPCCGSGTILIEAALQGASVCGGDRSPRAVAAARANVAAAGVKASVHQWDTTALPIATATMDRVITNLPWGRQVPVDEDLSSLYRTHLHADATGACSIGTSCRPHQCPTGDRSARSVLCGADRDQSVRATPYHSDLLSHSCQSLKRMMACLV